jgi:hypothetical protein
MTVLTIMALCLAGCGGGLAPLPTEQVTAGFPPHGIADTIRIDATDRLALREAGLIAPDGKATRATTIDVRPTPSVTTSQNLGNDPYAGDVFGVGNIGPPAALPVPAGGAPQTRTQLLLMLSTADILLPDPVAYRRDWIRWHIRLVFGIPPTTVIRDIPAPAPPAG